MDWIELSLTVPPRDVEPVADVLREHTGGVSLQEDVEILDEVRGYRVRPDSPVVLRAYLPVSDGSSERVWAIRREVASLPTAGSVEITLRKVREEDWAEAWKAYFDVEHVGERTVIRPTWRDYTPKPGEIVIDLNPGMAFGTGQHPTTRMCLAELERRVEPDTRVVDVGTGSGVLAIAAAKLGAPEVLAMDVEPGAVEAAGRNVRANGVESHVLVVEGSLDHRWPMVFPPVNVADLVVANINAATIIELARALFLLLLEDGILIAGGIIAEREEEVVQRLEQLGMGILRRQAEGEWRTITAYKFPVEGHGLEP